MVCRGALGQDLFRNLHLLPEGLLVEVKSFLHPIVVPEKGSQLRGFRHALIIFELPNNATTLHPWNLLTYV